MVLISIHIPPPRISEGKPCLTAEAKNCSSRNISSFLSRPVLFFIFIFWFQLYGCECVASIVPWQEVRVLSGRVRL